MASADTTPAIADPSAEVRYYDQGSLPYEDIRHGRSLTRQGGQALVNEIRAEAIKAAALTYGARAGLYSRMREINRMLDRRARQLDSVFQFGPCMLAHHIVPPVIQYSLDNVRISGGTQMRIADALYHIARPPRFSPVPPNWRTYLYLQAAKPMPPDETLMPDPGIAAEVALWEDYLKRGWDAGVRQADRSFEVALNRLVRDLNGMMLYREMLAKDMVTAPRVTEAFKGVTVTDSGDGETMAVNDRILEIAEPPQFNRDNQDWKPYASRAIRAERRERVATVTVVTESTPAPAKPAPKTSTSALIGGWGNR